MKTTTERRPFIAYAVDHAAQIIKKRGAVTIDELAAHLSAAGVDVTGNDELTGDELACCWDRQELAEIPVVASGSTEFVLTVLALVANRPVNLNAADPAGLKLKWDGRWDDKRKAPKQNLKSGHYHILTVRDPGRPQQIADCHEDTYGLTVASQVLDEYLSGIVLEGWDAVFIVGCGPDRCRHETICDLPVEEWGEPRWADWSVFTGKSG